MSLPPRRALLPREGFHADVLGTWAKWTILNPVLTIPALLAARYTEQGQELAAKYVSSRAWTWASFFAGWGVLRVLNNILDRRVQNNGVSDKYDWTKEVVVITGGADGIGKETALLLASLNIKVVVLDIQPLTYEAPKSLLYVKTNITSAQDLATANAKIKERFGADPTVIILNAGVCRGKSILEGTEADTALTFQVNAISHYTAMREFLPSIVKANHGMIVTVASTAAWVTASGMTDYAGSKAAALAFHEGLSAELVTHFNAPKVRTVVLNQGYTKTALFQGFGVKPGFVGPPMEVATVAEAVVRQVLSGESAQIILPGVYKGMGAHWRSFPGWMQHAGRINLANLMKGWTGRQVKELDQK